MKRIDTSHLRTFLQCANYKTSNIKKKNNFCDFYEKKYM